MNITKTAAIHLARRAITMGRFGRRWVVYQPWEWDKPHGATTASAPRNYWAARRLLTATRAEFALAMMGHEGKLIGTDDVWGSLTDIVTRVRARSRSN